MTPREIVLAQIRHQETAQVPYTLAFGHTHLATLRQVKGLDAEVEVDVRYLDDQEMFSMLVTENRVLRGYPTDVFDRDVLRCLRAIAQGRTRFASGIPPTATGGKLQHLPDYLDPADVAGGRGGSGCRCSGRRARPVHGWPGDMSERGGH